MRRVDRQEWAEAYDKEYQGFVEHGTLKIVRPVPGVKILGTTTRAEYKVVNGVLKKRKIRLCAMGNQQKEGVHYKAGELYAPVMKASEVRMFLAKAAQLGLSVLKSDTKQAFLNGDIGTELLYIRPPDWWPELVPEGHVLQLMKSMYGTRQAARTAAGPGSGHGGRSGHPSSRDLRWIPRPRRSGRRPADRGVGARRDHGRQGSQRHP